jgi:hypothetical protein
MEITKKAPAAAEASGASRPAGLLRCRSRLFGVLAAEALHAAGRIYQALLAGKERVAVGADFESDLTLVGRASLKGVAARAINLCGLVCGVNPGFRHDLVDLSCNLLSLPWIHPDGNRMQGPPWAAHLAPDPCNPFSHYSQCPTSVRLAVPGVCWIALVGPTK